MRYVGAAVAGLFGAALGWALVAGATILIGDLVGVPQGDGGFAMSAFFGIGPIGGVIGLVLGIWLVLRRGGGAGGWGASARRVAIVLGIIVATVGGVAAYLYETRPLLGSSSGAAPRLDFEIRLAQGLALPGPPEKIQINLNTEKNRMPGSVAAVRRDDGRIILPGSVELHYYSSWRLLDVVFTPGAPVHIFDLKLAARPGHMTAFGPWRPVDMTAEADQQPKPVTGTPAYEIRTRVVYPD